MGTQITKFMGPTWGPLGSCGPQMGPMLAPWTLLSGNVSYYWPCPLGFHRWRQPNGDRRWWWGKWYMAYPLVCTSCRPNIFLKVTVTILCIQKIKWKKEIRCLYWNRILFPQIKKKREHFAYTTHLHTRDDTPFWLNNKNNIQIYSYIIYLY